MNDMLNKKEAGSFKGIYYTASSDIDPAADLSILSPQTHHLDQEIDEIKKYNRELLTAIPDYSNLIFTGGRVLIKMFLKVPKKGSLLTFNKIKVPKAKPGEFDEIDNPFNYTDVGIIVAKDPGIDYFNINDIVQVEHSVITPMIAPGTSSLYLPASYVKYNTHESDKVNKGYVLCYPRNIVCKILEVNESDFC